MGALIEQLERDFDTVIVDAPPLLPVTDAAVLSQFVGGVVLVVGSHKIKHQDLQKSLSALDMVGATLLGVVLNRLPVKGPDSYTYSYYSNDEVSALPSDEGRFASSTVMRFHVDEPLVTADFGDARPATSFPKTKNS
jgi:Mrp family chromosome partitioning ATPase